MKLLLLLVFAQTAFAYNILVQITLVGKSHLDFVSSLISTLVDRGHAVDLVVGEFNTAVKWQGVTKARNATSYSFTGRSPWMDIDHLTIPFETLTNVDIDIFIRVSYQLCEIGLESGNAVSFMKQGKYDAVLISDYDYCGFMMARAAGIRTVMSYTSTNLLPFTADHLGLPNPVSCVANNFDAYEGDFSLISKVKRLLHTGYHKYATSNFEISKANELAYKYFGPNFPAVQQVTRDIDLVFVNSNEIIEMPRTISHKVRYIGGVSLKQPKAISQEFEQMLSSQPNGAVIISFGTQVPAENFPPRAKHAIAKAAESFPDFTFIWKYSHQPGDELFFKNATNLRLVDWLPQTDLLYNPKVRGFITHAGLNSFTEFAHAGVPVVLIPLFADQAFNARNAVRLGLGIQLNKLRFTDAELIAALKEILNNPSYSKQSRHILKMLATSPTKAKETFVQWTEFAIQNGNLHQLFNLPEAEMGVFSYYCIDVVVFLLFILLSTLFLVHATVKKCRTQADMYMKKTK